MIDHLVYATPDLEASARDFGGRLGVSPAPGGQHVGRGTRNYLLSLGASSYLELIGPDLEQPEFSGVRSMGLDTLDGPRLAAWAIHVPDMELAVDQARKRGYDPGPAHSMSRRQSDGQILNWKLTDVPGDVVPFLLPFLIDWGDSLHPSQTAPKGARMLEFRIESPDPEKILNSLESLGIRVPVERGERPRLVATIEGPDGTVRLE
ncbi:MAG TPA: VOC family protein [Chloroflexota bacterium]